MPSFTRSESQALAACVKSFSESFRRDVADVLAAQFRGIQPAEVTELIGQLALVERQLEARTKPVNVHDANSPLLKRVLIEARREIARAIEAPLQKAIDGQVIKMLKREISFVEHLMSAAWFAEATPVRVPELTDYMSIRHAEAAMPEPLVLAPREYDEKFHILEAPSLFLPDLAHYRRRCRFRGAPVAVGYLDIDDFKEFNTRHTESKVDLDLLAPFMEIIEAHVFARGHAYRFGGDEYVLTLPNMARSPAVDFLRALQERIGRASFRGISRAPTVSIGLCVVGVDCALTEREAQERANAAKNFAKSRKKGSIATFEGELYRDADLVVA